MYFSLSSANRRADCLYEIIDIIEVDGDEIGNIHG